MVVALPYPPMPPKPGVTPSGDTGRVTITPAELETVIGGTLQTAERTLPVAAQIVTEYAPQAPTALLNEAVVRLSGYLVQSDFGTVREETIGPRSVSYQMNHAMMFRNSGAQALLTRYKHRRAGTI